MANDLIIQALCDKVSLNIQKDRDWRASRLVNMQRWKEIVPLERAWKLRVSSHIPCPKHLFHLAVWVISFYNKLEICYTLKCFSEFCELLWKIKQMGSWRRLWKPPVWSQLVRSTINSLDLQLESERGGGSLAGLNPGIWNLTLSLGSRASEPSWTLRCSADV